MSEINPAAWPPVLTAQQVADALDCTAQTINERCLSGDLPGIKLGRGWILPAAALLTHLNAQASANLLKPVPQAHQAGQDSAGAPAIPEPAPGQAIFVSVPQRPASTRGRRRRGALPPALPAVAGFPATPAAAH